jgi:hypothetical protein
MVRSTTELSRPEKPSIAPEEQAAFTRTGAVWVDVGELRIGKVSISGTRYAGVGSNNLEKERGGPIATRIDGRVDASSALKEDHCSQLFGLTAREMEKVARLRALNTWPIACKQPWGVP